MEIQSIDPRDIGQHRHLLAWRVYFYADMGAGQGLVADEFRLTGEADVRAVLSWADAAAQARTVVCYAEIATGDGPALVLVSGTEPP